jgi:MSHA biogenesis protein MshL
VALTFSGCAQVKEQAALPTIQDELRKAIASNQARPSPAPLPAAVEAALAPQTRLELPRNIRPAAEARFDLAVNAAAATQVFLGIASGTSYSMLLHPEVAGTITVSLKDVTVIEAMDALRELYGYEYRVEGKRIFVQPLTAQTRFYTIPYPTGTREGKSETNVNSGSITEGKSTNTNNNNTNSQTTNPSSQVKSSSITTNSKSDFWTELKNSVGLLIGCNAENCPENRSVMVSPHTGMLAIRALPKEHREVNHYLKVARLTVERQVMIEAKIIEVTLNENAQTGINWAAIGSGKNSPFAISSNLGQATFPSSAPPFLGSTADFGALNQAASNGMFGIAFQTDVFATLMQFLETQGQVQVLSSPRIAAINNQKALLKVGSEDYYVTSVQQGTRDQDGVVTTPVPTFSPLFSGIALDVTPQIDENDFIILHVHPSISLISTKGIVIDNDYYPLASTSISEADSIVRLKEGQTAAIGGLMKHRSNDNSSGFPGLGDIPLIGAMFKHTNKVRQKQELVILLKPTLIRQQSDWMEGVRDTSERLQNFSTPTPQK